MILSLYYKIWVDAMVYEKTKHGHLRNWKTYTLLPLSIIQGVNLFTLLIWLSFSGVKFDVFFDFDFLPGTMLDGFLSGFISLFLPFILLNYFLIFYNKQYEKLINEYKYKNGKLYLTYFLVSIGICIIPLILGKVFILI
jgi:hypothetical protein